MKPKTAFINSQNREEAKVKARAQTIGNYCRQPEFVVPNRSKPVSIIQLLKNQKEKSEDSRKNSTKGTQFIKIDTRVKNTIDPHATTRSKSSYKSSAYIHF